MYTRHEVARGRIAATAGQTFAYLDDQTRLSSHMSKRSWKMGWGKMDFTLDDGGGHTVGSHVRLSGRVLGVRLFLEEVVIERDAPRHKAWETVGEPRLLVIGAYRMAFDIQPRTDGVEVRVGIDYELPTRGIARLLGRVFGRAYAQWCTRQMVVDAQVALSNQAGPMLEHATRAWR